MNYKEAREKIEALMGEYVTPEIIRAMNGNRELISIPDRSGEFEWVRVFQGEVPNRLNLNPSEEDRWHKDHSNTSLPPLKWEDYSNREEYEKALPLVKTLSREEAISYVKANRAFTDEELHNKYQTRSLGLAGDFLNCELYRCWAFLTPDNHLVIWGDDGNCHGSILGYGGHIFTEEELA